MFGVCTINGVVVLIGQKCYIGGLGGRHMEDQFKMLKKNYPLAGIWNRDQFNVIRFDLRKDKGEFRYAEVYLLQGIPVQIRRIR